MWGMMQILHYNNEVAMCANVVNTYIYIATYVRKGKCITSYSYTQTRTAISFPDNTIYSTTAYSGDDKELVIKLDLDK